MRQTSWLREGVCIKTHHKTKVVELIKRTPRESRPGDFVPDSGTLQGSLELQNVVFAYPGRPTQRVLNGLSLAVSPGEVVALVGPSGGGKSTIIKLLERFYLPSSGRVLVDGRDLGLYDPKWLRRHIALVSQEPVLFARSIRDNIVYGLEEADDWGAVPTQGQVEEAARQANAHEFISAFPDGYNTACGQKGVVLSGGQKQRIAIARALVRQPQVLLLDEATSALDTESEAVVQQALSRLMAGRTVLVIAHRLSTIRDADRICVISGGQLSEQGSHEELLSTKGIYAGLIARQLAASGSSDGLEGGQPLSLGSFGSSRGAGGSLSDLSDGARASLQEVSGRGSMSSSRSSACRDRSSTEAAADNAAAAASAAAAAAAGEASRSQQQQ